MKKAISLIAQVLIILGALNWGLWGFFQFDLVAWLFDGNTTMLSRVIYAIVGLAGVWAIGCFSRCCHGICCHGKKEGGGGSCCK